MAHLIDMSNGRANMAFVGETPWHGLGQELPEGVTVDEMTQAAGLGYDVNRAPVMFLRGDTYRSVTGKHVLYRSDTGAPLGVVSDGYNIVQPRDVMEFFRDLCEQRGFKMNTAGALKGGAVYWALARTPFEANIGKRGNADNIKGYLLLSTSADGTRATDLRFTSIRVVCNNTLSVATGGTARGSDNKGVKTKHSAKFDAQAAKEALGLVDYESRWDAFLRNMRALQDVEISPGQATAYFSQLLRPAGERTAPRDMQADDFATLLNAPVSASPVAAPIVTDKARAIRGLAEMERCYTDAPGAAPGTLYGALQAVTRFVDHERGSDNVDKRLTSAWFGQGDTLKNRAAEFAAELANDSSAFAALLTK